ASSANLAWVIPRRRRASRIRSLPIPFILLMISSGADISPEAARRCRDRVQSPLVPATASPYVIDVRDLVHRPGELRERTLEFDAPEQLGAGAAVVPAGSPLGIDLRLEGLHEGVLVTGEADATASGEYV